MRRSGPDRHGMRGGSLDDAPAAQTVRVVRVTGGDHLVQRLAALGVVPGASLTVLRGRHPVLVALGGSRLAIDRRTARSILVEADCP